MASLVQTLAVAEYLSFHKAAKALGISQSSVSARVKSLEEELGILLFHRNTRGVSLTEAGRRFVEQVDEAMVILDDAIKTAGMRAHGVEGHLRVGIHSLTTGGALDHLLRRFRSEHPLIQLHISETSARDAQIKVREGKLDIAFMADIKEIPDLHSRVVWHDRVMVAVSTTHRLASRSSIDWQQLADEPFLVRQGGSGPQVQELIVLRSVGRWPIPNIIRLDIGNSALLSMIAAEHGISLFLEESALTPVPGVVFLPIADEPESVRFSAVWSPNNRSPVLSNLLSVALKLRQSSVLLNSPSLPAGSTKNDRS
ncbi:LysR family transcriptional regulator [Agrobacterium vitis]|uniref:LysR family transcriptional regulator n=1 Tax=Rhizobium/Agrobacterium group TaxID=227290 RepID=UPI001F3FABED|nr:MULTISPECIES: LysR family transcriptional regulator [Rhizobium/Agrobacterium group]MCF1501682.1 LysR family transcriptional regulator [Allorhizobium sp. Av2]MCM2438532.1 LysR family transcriptional regulator [Agrobacterium vitis]MCM2473131.1 LysR family transcriptional regulator [Rhizobium sp. CG5]